MSTFQGKKSIFKGKRRKMKQAGKNGGGKSMKKRKAYFEIGGVKVSGN